MKDTLVYTTIKSTCIPRSSGTAIAGGDVTLDVLSTFGDGLEFDSNPDNKIAYRVYYKIANDPLPDNISEYQPYIGIKAVSQYLWVGIPDLNISSTPLSYSKVW